MIIPLPLRLTLFYTLLLALALWFFGATVYTQAEQRAYQDLDTTLRTRAASVRLGKDIYAENNLVKQLPSVDELGAGGISIEVLNDTMSLIASTAPSNDPAQTTIDDIGSSPIPWDKAAYFKVLKDKNSRNGIFTTLTYKGQRIRIYTVANQAYSSDVHIIQTARTERDIEQSLNNLRQILWQGAALVLVLALLGGWLIGWGTLAAVRRITRTAQQISASRDFSKRVPASSLLKRDELTTLAATFNQMLGNLQDAYQRQQRFVADASHELRAPVTSIRCNLDLLARAPDLPSEEVQAALEDARSESARMGRLVNDLLQLARADNQRQPGAQPRVDLDSLLLEAFRQYRPPEDREGTPRGPRLLLQHIAPVQVRGDADQLKQAIVALLDNALKYTPQEGSVTLSLNTAGGHAQICVSDTGIGIAPADLPHIFERFYRADRIRPRDRGGSGLGLAIVQSIAQEHNGTIEVASTPGKGSTFTLNLPILQ